MSSRISSLRVTYEEQFGSRGGVEQASSRASSLLATPSATPHEEDGAVVPDSAAHLPEDVAGEVEGFANSYRTLTHSKDALLLTHTQQRATHPNLCNPPLPPPPPTPSDTYGSVSTQFTSHLYGTLILTWPCTHTAQYASLLFAQVWRIH